MARRAAWYTRPVFVSSTFCDMHAERDHLRDVVFPELAERLRARRHHLEAIDLRWGVQTVSATEEQARELLVLKVCLDEIDRCRPFFIVLLGDRYGWVPPPDALAAAAGEKGLSAMMAGQSVTALEIAYGPLHDPAQARRCLAYLRQPLPYDEMPPELAALYSEAHSPAPGAREAGERLRALKERLQVALGPGRVRHYAATWDAARRRVTGLDEWGRLVLEDLWRQLDAETAALAAAPAPTWQEEERATLDEFIEERARGFVGRSEALQSLREVALGSGDGPWAAVVTGAAGTGKSALLARLARDLEAAECLVLAHAAGISARAGSVEAMLRRWNGELSAHLGLSAGGDEATGLPQVEQQFAERLSQAAARGRVVLLVDALNQFERTPAARHLTWLPELWPANARLIATAIAGEESAALCRRPGVVTLALPPLDEREAAGMVAAIAARHHKAVHPAVAAALVERRTPGGESAAGNPLWLSIAVETLLLLDEEDFARAPRYAGTPEAQLQALLRETAAGLPATVEALYGELLQRAGRRFGAAWVAALLDLLAAARHGLREADLRQLVPALVGEGWSDLRFAGLRRYLRAHLARRGAEELWDFRHAQLRACAVAGVSAQVGRAQALQRRLLEHLERRPRGDPLRAAELMYHYIQADEQLGAAGYYGGALTDEEAAGATRALAELIIAGGAKQPNPGLAWVASLLQQEETRLLLRGLCGRYQFDLLHALTGNASVAISLALLQEVRGALERLHQRAPEDVDHARDLAVSYHKLGEVYLALGEPVRAREPYERCLAIAKMLRQRVPDRAEYARDLAVSYERLGNLCVLLDELAQARKLFGECLAIADELRRCAPDNVEYARIWSVSRIKLGELYVALGETAQAREFYERAIKIDEELHRRAPAHGGHARELAVSYERLGDLHLALGETVQALEFYQKDLAIAEELHRRAPDNVEYARVLMVSYHKLGELYVKQGDFAGARQVYKEGLAIAEMLRRQTPDRAEYANDLMVSYERLGNLHLALGEPAQAREFYEQAREIAEEMRSRAPSNAQYARAFVVLCYSLARTAQQQGDGAEAARELGRCRQVLLEMRAHGMYLDPPLAQLLEQLGG
ncbi:MAG TPA: tetratricopeptide repeat protein [Anaerolineae bacterium]|nr:tetratricopeptide repeat protein [Anaerolineae bacterium]HOQ98620.1 tetratricopeptide repeat protein [Anaerolineae bacterium]HPL27159.1 tetratricopeptide repeat protein [Anaerolineae bacterium]